MLSSAAIIPAASIRDSHSPGVPSIRAVSTTHHALSNPSSVAGVVDAIRLAFQAERGNAVLLPQHVRLEGYTVHDTSVGTTQGGQTEYPRKRMDRISFFDPSVKFSVFEEKRGPARKYGRTRHLEKGYLSKPQQRTEQRGSAAIRRAELEVASRAKAFIYADHKTGKHTVQMGLQPMGSEENSNERMKLRPSSETVISSSAASQPLPQTARADFRKRLSVETQTTSGTTTEPSVTPSSSDPESSGTAEEATKKGNGVFQSAVGSIGSLYSSFIRNISGAKPENGNKVPESVRSQGPGAQASDDEVKAVVNEIIAQVMVRTADEVKENKKFLGHEKVVDARGRIAVRPVMELVQRIVSRILESAGWSVKIQKPIHKQTRDRLLRLKSQTRIR